MNTNDSRGRDRDARARIELRGLLLTIVEEYRELGDQQMARKLEAALGEQQPPMCVRCHGLADAFDAESGWPPPDPDNFTRR